MKPTIKIDRARQIIQGWFREYCSDYGKPEIVLEVAEEHGDVPSAYRVTNPESGRNTRIFWSSVSDYETMGSIGIPGDMKSEIWDAFSDLF